MYNAVLLQQRREKKRLEKQVVEPPKQVGVVVSAFAACMPWNYLFTTLQLFTVNNLLIINYFIHIYLTLELR